jgi:amino acid transporter
MVAAYADILISYIYNPGKAVTIIAVAMFFIIAIALTLSFYRYRSQKSSIKNAFVKNKMLNITGSVFVLFIILSYFLPLSWHSTIANIFFYIALITLFLAARVPDYNNDTEC